MNKSLYLAFLPLGVAVPAMAQPAPYDHVYSAGPVSTKETAIVQIRSDDIEDSYYKWTGDLPASYQAMIDGQLQADPARATLVRPAHGVWPATWRLKCKRSEVSGAMTVESALDRNGLVADDPQAENQWFGQVNALAVIDHYTQPGYRWFFSGDGTISPLMIDYVHDPWPLLFPTNNIAFSDLSDDSELEDFWKTSVLHLEVHEDDLSAPTKLLTNTYTIHWHPPVEWLDSKPGTPIWETIAPESTRVGTALWTGSVEASWRWKAVELGEVTNASDYWLGFLSEAWGTVSDVLGIDNIVGDKVDDKIGKLADPRLKFLLKAAKKAGQIYGDQLLEEFAGKPDVPLIEGFQGLWAQHDLEGGENSNWENTDGADVPRPNIDFDFLLRGKDGLSDAEKATYESQLAEIEKWVLSDPKLQVKKNRYLFNGDNYDHHGFFGYSYKGIDVFSGQKRVTGTFKRAPEPQDPQPEPNG